MEMLALEKLVRNYCTDEETELFMNFANELKNFKPENINLMMVNIAKIGRSFIELQLSMAKAYNSIGE